MRRVVITAIGLISPCGLDTESTWNAVCEGRSGIGPITLFDADAFATKIAGECTGFDPLQFIEKKRLREGGRFIHLAVGASQEVVDKSGLTMAHATVRAAEIQGREAKLPHGLHRPKSQRSPVPSLGLQKDPRKPTLKTAYLTIGSYG